MGDDAQMDRLAGDEGQMDEYISVVGGRVGGWMYIVDPAIPGASIDEEKGEFWGGGLSLIRDNHISSHKRSQRSSTQRQVFTSPLYFEV